MIPFFQVLLTLISVIAVSMALTLFLKVKAGLSPLLTLGSVIALLILAGMINLAAPVATLFFGLSAVSCVFIFIRIKEDKAALLLFTDVGFISFVLLSIFFITLFSIRQPLFYEWDDFSFWGTAARVVSETNLLYSVAESNLYGPSHPPALIMAAYLFNFLGEYEAFRHLLGYDILLFAAFGAILSCFDKDKRHFAVAILVILLVSPFIALNIFGRAVHLIPGFMSGYADYPMGIIFGATLTVYFCRVGGRLWSIITTFILLFLLTLCKETGLAFALLAAGLISVDILFTAREYHIIKRVLTFIGLMVTPVVAYVSWAIHLGAVADVDRTDTGGEEGLSMGEMMFTGITELVSPSVRTEKFSAVFENLIRAFFFDRVMLLGSGFVIIIAITLLLLAAFILSKEKRSRINIALFYVFSLLGCMAYNIFLGFTYVYIFTGDTGIALISYSRYVMPYYLGWFIFAFVYTAFLLQRSPRLKRVTQPALVLAGCGIFAVSHMLTPAELTYIGYADSHFAAGRETIQKIETAKQHFDSEDIVFYMHSSDDGYGWFQNYYYFFPYNLDYSGGGDLARYGGDGLTEYLAEIGADIVYIDHLDITAGEEYRHLFSDGLSSYFEGETYVYSVEMLSTGVIMHPIEMNIE